MNEIENNELKEIKIKKGIPYGVVWGILLFSSFVYLFFFIAGYFLFNHAKIDSFLDLIIIIFSSAFYIGASGFLFFIVLFTSIYLTYKDTNLKNSVKKNWPIILAFLYPMIPNLPGPWDEGILSIVMFCVRLIIFFKTGKTIENKK